MVPNEKNELVLMKPVTGWRVCIDSIGPFSYIVHGSDVG